MSGRGVVFLDRDGTVLDLVPYLHEPEKVRLIPGAAAALRRLGDAGWARVLVTNQSGIARGWFTLDHVERVHQRMLELLRAEGADLEAIEICPHHPEHTGACDCRKPASGMLTRAASRLGIAGGASWVIGDRIEDLEAGSPLGASGILVLTGYGSMEALKLPPEGLQTVRVVASDLAAAVSIILSQDRAEGMRP